MCCRGWVCPVVGCVCAAVDNARLRVRVSSAFALASATCRYLDELVMQPQARVRVSSQLIAEAQTSNGQMYIPNKWVRR